MATDVEVILAACVGNAVFFCIRDIRSLAFARACKRRCSFIVSICDGLAKTRLLMQLLCLRCDPCPMLPLAACGRHENGPEQGISNECSVVCRRGDC